VFQMSQSSVRPRVTTLPLRSGFMRTNPRIPTGGKPACPASPRKKRPWRLDQRSSNGDRPSRRSFSAPFVGTFVTRCRCAMWKSCYRSAASLGSKNSPLVFAVLLNAGREFEPESLPPRITFRNAINSRRVPNHILLTLFDYSWLPFRVQCGARPDASRPGRFSARNSSSQSKAE
jgi:hypothetical protein